MMDRILVGLLIMLYACSWQDLISQDVLLIQSGPRQGIPSRDLQVPGIKSGYGYNTFIITNDTTVDIHLRIALSDEFQLPTPFDAGKFKLFLLPRELTPDTITFPDSVSSGLRDFLANNVDSPSTLNKLLEPGSKCVITVGLLASRSGNCGVNLYLVQNNSGIFPECESRMNKHLMDEPKAILGLQMVFNHIGDQTPVSCMIVPFGQISYPE